MLAVGIGLSAPPPPNGSQIVKSLTYPRAVFATRSPPDATE